MRGHIGGFLTHPVYIFPAIDCTSDPSHPLWPAGRRASEEKVGALIYILRALVPDAEQAIVFVSTRQQVRQYVCCMTIGSLCVGGWGLDISFLSARFF